MKNLLKSFEYDGYADLFKSLAPSLKYHLTILLFATSAIATFVQQTTGLQAIAVISFVAIMAAELVSGIKASAVSNNGKFNFSSQRFSRFLFKLFYYFALLFFCHSMNLHYLSVGKEMTAGTFDWMHTYLVVHIGGENIISVLENVAVIEGKPKTHYLQKVKARIAVFK
jgi:preprotein translocase subunit SecG